MALELLMNTQQICHLHRSSDVSGITVKCHESRSLQRNRKRARELMVQKMDNLLNGEDSLDNQRRRIDENKNRSQEAKRKKLEKLKLEWKKNEELDEVKDI